MNKNEIIKNIWSVYNGIWTDIAVGFEDENENGKLEFYQKYHKTKQFNNLLSLLCEEKIWNEFM